jgi:hypothetical protein
MRGRLSSRVVALAAAVVIPCVLGTGEDAATSGAFPKRAAIEVEVSLVELSEEAYLECEEAVNGAVGKGDVGTLRSLGEKAGVDRMTMPRVTTPNGREARIQSIREFRHPTEFEFGEAGASLLRPTAFQTTNIGMEVLVTPTLRDEGIELKGRVVVRTFEGFLPEGQRASSPAFRTTEVNFHRVEKDGQTAGFWVPEGRTVKEPSQRLETVIIVNPAPGPSNAADDLDGTERRRLAVLLTARELDLSGTPRSQAKANAKPAGAGRTESDADADAGVPYAVPVPGKAGHVFSPHAPEEGYVDVRGIEAGTEVKCPFSGRMFLVP